VIRSLYAGNGLSLNILTDDDLKQIHPAKPVGNPDKGLSPGYLFKTAEAL